LLKYKNIFKQSERLCNLRWTSRQRRRSNSTLSGLDRNTTKSQSSL